MSLPAGTVTFVFTDIEGSTKLLARVGDAAYGEILDTERTLVGDAMAAQGGSLFGSEGDAHFVAFGSAAAALRGAVAAQLELGSHPWPSEVGRVLVRMGIHTGEAQVVGDDYVGLEVHRAARVAAAAHGGQILVTDATRVLAGELGTGIGLRDLGEHRLKDLARPERLYQVTSAGLPDGFPPLRTVEATPNNLPPQLTSFVGRAEVGTASELLAKTRLLTLTGPGGTGKTRLSLALAGDCVERYPDGAWFVPLASVTDPELVPSAIAASVGLLAPSRPPVERVKDHFRDRAALLVLDNFEQVVAAAPMVADLLRAAPRLTTIVSSRAPLRIAGEQEFPVPPLALPPTGVENLETLMDSEAVLLFVERAMAVRPDFALTPDNGRHVAEIVRRLDGLPLAIELAAARIRLLSPAAMAQRLGDRLSLLSAGGRDLPERQRTLRGAIDWSHDLLDADDQRLFARLGVFAGGGPLETAEAVCGIPDDPAPIDVFGGLERLAEQSLVRIEDDPHGGTRFLMLETIREYALEKLAERGELTALRERHAERFLAYVTQAGAVGPGTGDRGVWLDRLDEDHDNLRAALEHLVAVGDRARAADFVYAVWRFWQMRGHIIEGRRRADAVLALWPEGGDPDLQRLRALEAAGGLAYWAGDMAAAGLHYAAGATEARRLGDDRELANALFNLFFARRPSQDVEDWVSLMADDDKSMLDEALAIWTRLGDEHGEAKALWGLAEHYSYRGDLAAAEEASTRALAIFERTTDGFWIAWTRFTRAVGRAMDGRVGQAAGDLAESLRQFRASGDVSGVVLCLSAMASVLLWADRPEDAYAVGAAARRAAAETGLHIASMWSTSDIPTPDTGTRDPVLAAAASEGASWSREQAVERAIELGTELSAAPRRPA